MSSSKPRILIDGKDMVWTMIPLLALCALVVFASGNCSVGLTGGAEDDQRPPFAIDAALQADAATMSFPVRQPPTPDGWRPNSGSTQEVGGRLSSNVGWLTNEGSYLQLTQTDAAEEPLVASLSGDDRATGTGTQNVGGETWVTYETERDRTFWIADLGDVRIAILSIAPDDVIAAMAESVLEQQPLSRERP